MINYKIQIVSDRALSVEFEDADKIRSNLYARELAKTLENGNYDWLEGTKIFSKSLLVLYNPAYCTYKRMEFRLRLMIRKLDRAVAEKLADKGQKSKVHYIPVCYSGEYAKDIDACAETLGISRDELVKAHTGRDLLVMCHLFYGEAGLSPAGADALVRTENKKVVTGDILFDGNTTVIVSTDRESDLPVIGRTYVKTYDRQSTASVFDEGDYIRFVSVGENKFKKLSDKGAYDTEMRRAGVHNEDNGA